MRPNRAVRAVGPSRYQPSPVAGAAQADSVTGLGFGGQHDHAGRRSAQITGGMARG